MKKRLKKKSLSRLMRNRETGREYAVSEFFMTKNFWEYFVIELEDEEESDDDVKFCYVMGYESEFGDVYIPEVKPYIMTHTIDLSEVAAPKGFEWVGGEDA